MMRREFLSKSGELRLMDDFRVEADTQVLAENRQQLLSIRLSRKFCDVAGAELSFVQSSSSRYTRCALCSRSC